MKNGALILLLILCLVIISLQSCYMDFRMGPNETEPPKTEQPAATEKPAEPPIDWADVVFPVLPEQQTETQSPVQIPETEPQRMYTNQQLNALSNEWIPYGPGLATGGDPAPYAPSAQKEYGKYDAHFIEDAQNVIYLTFDCGYEFYLDGKPVTGMILDTLKEKDVKAVFFVTGSYVEKNPEMVQRIIDEGHALGNHSSSHTSMPGLSIDDMQAQIMTLHDQVKDKFGYTMKFFRPPEGSFSLRSLAVTQNLGYETVHWSFAYADWNTGSQPDPEEALDKILSCHHDGAIYLLHAVSTTNAEILGDVIDGLRDLGYRLDLLS